MKVRVRMAGKEAVPVAGDPVFAASVADGFLRRRRPRAVSQPREHLIGERTRAGRDVILVR